MHVNLVGISEDVKSHRIYMDGLAALLSGFVTFDTFSSSMESGQVLPSKNNNPIWHLTSQFLAPRIQDIAQGKIVMTGHDLFPLTVARAFIEDRYSDPLRLHLSDLRTVDEVIAVSDYSRRELLDFGVDDQKISVVPPYVDEKTFRPRTDTNPLFEKYPQLSRQKKYVLTVASIWERKNLLRMIMAFSHLARKKPDVDYILVTDPIGPGGHEVKFAVRHFGLEDRIHVIPNVTNENLARLYSISSCLFFVTLAEGFGIPIIESMLSGCPVMGSRNSGSQETAGNAALLVNPNNVEEIAGNLEALLENQTLRESLRSMGYARAKLFSADVVRKKLLQVYQRTDSA